jgi:CIC family chloride channel protein
VRAPLTGIVLVVEMTGSVTMLLPMLGACFAAMLLTTALQNPPIYDSLLERTEKMQELGRSRPPSNPSKRNPSRPNLST